MCKLITLMGWLSLVGTDHHAVRNYSYIALVMCIWHWKLGVMYPNACTIHAVYPEALIRSNAGCLKTSYSMLLSAWPRAILRACSKGHPVSESCFLSSASLRYKRL